MYHSTLSLRAAEALDLLALVGGEVGGGRVHLSRSLSRSERVKERERERDRESQREGDWGPGFRSSAPDLFALAGREVGGGRVHLEPRLVVEEHVERHVLRECESVSMCVCVSVRVCECVSECVSVSVKCVGV